MSAPSYPDLVLLAGDKITGKQKGFSEAPK
jgi:hypothetical protein